MHVTLQWLNLPSTSSAVQAIAEKRAAKKIEREIKRRHKFVERCRVAVQDKMDEMVEEARKAEEARKRAELVSTCCRMMGAAVVVLGAAAVATALPHVVGRV